MISTIKRLESEEKDQSKSQEDLYNEESIYTRFTSNDDNKIMPEFHKVNWSEKLLVLNKFKEVDIIKGICHGTRNGFEQNY